MNRSRGTSSPRREPGARRGAPRDRSRSLTIATAVEVIRRSDREHPADAVLRFELKSRPELSAVSRRDISHAVFSYYRWRGWLPEKLRLEARVGQALDLAERFRKNPFSFPEEQWSRAVPAWLEGFMKYRADWLRSLQREPTLWLRARRGRAREVARRLRDCRLAQGTRLSDAVEYRGRANLFQTEEFEASDFELQDIASQAVGVVCDPKPGESWLDACAGEGGKTLHLSELMENRGLIQALDRAEWRLKRLKRRAARAAVFNYRTALWSGEESLPMRTRFDGVLVDAPCTGVGTWKRNPHARWTVKPEDVRELGALQKQLLARVAPAVKPGGKLIYAVCTLTVDETRDVVRVFNDQSPDFEPLPVINPFEPDFPPSAQWTLWPQDTGGNGMFVAAWRRR
jgi:16S rRNA (cytosine967-C5)-methyltransferase